MFIGSEARGFTSSMSRGQWEFDETGRVLPLEIEFNVPTSDVHGAQRQINGLLHAVDTSLTGIHLRWADISPVHSEHPLSG